MHTYIALLTMMFPLLGLPLGLYGIYRNFRSWSIYVFCIALFFGAWAYVYNPTIETDLTRYFDYINSLSNISLIETMSSGIYGSSVQALFGFVIMSWGASQLGDPHLIAAFTVFAIYYVSLKITCQIGADYKINNKRIILHIVFLIFIINFYGITNNIRNVFSFSLIILAVFRECYENKKNALTYFLYLFPLFIHPSAFVLLFIRFFISSHHVLKFLFSCCLVCSYFLVGFIYNYNFLSHIEIPIARILNLLIVKSYNYFYDTSSDYGLAVAASPSEYLLKLFYIGMTIVITSYALLVLKNINTEKKPLLNISKLISFELFLCFLTIACIPMLRPEYWRFAAAALICSAPVFLFGDYYLKKRLYIQIFTFLRVLFVPLCFSLWFRNFLRYANLEEMVINSVFTSPLLIFIVDISNLLFS